MTTPMIFDTAESIRRHVEQLFGGDRCSKGLTFLLCDADGRGRIASPIDQAPANPSEEECGSVASVFAEAVSEYAGGVLLVIHRTAPATVQASDLAWLRAVRTQCAGHGVRCIGVWLVTPSTARELGLDDLDEGISGGAHAA